MSTFVKSDNLPRFVIFFEKKLHSKSRKSATYKIYARANARMRDLRSQDMPGICMPGGNPGILQARIDKPCHRSVLRTDLAIFCLKQGGFCENRRTCDIKAMAKNGPKFGKVGLSGKATPETYVISAGIKIGFPFEVLVESGQKSPSPRNSSIFALIF